MKNKTDSESRIVKATRGKSNALIKPYEVSTVGDKRFSAFCARMPDGRSIEEVYQCDIKLYDLGGQNWAKGKGKPSKFPYPDNMQYEMYLGLWRYWSLFNLAKIRDLISKLPDHDYTLNDVFATNECNQATALADVLNTMYIGNPAVKI